LWPARILTDSGNFTGYVKPGKPTRVYVEEESTTVNSKEHSVNIVVGWTPSKGKNHTFNFCATKSNVL